MWIEQKNTAALRLRELYGPLGLDKFMSHMELRKVAPFFGYVDIEIGGVSTFAMLSSNDDFVAERYFWLGKDAYEPMSLRIWNALARKSAFICDIGSYTGVFSLSAACANRRSKVFAFEALDRVYFRLVLNKSVNSLGNLSTFHLAMSETPGEQELNVYSGEGILVTASSLREKATQREVIERKRVKTHSLDALVDDGSVPGVSLLKIDAEGAEHLVLRGAARALEKHKPDVVCELIPGAQTEEIERRFRDMGYRFLAIDEARMELRPLDSLAVSKGEDDRNTLFTTRPDAELRRLVDDLLGSSPPE